VDQAGLDQVERFWERGRQRPQQRPLGLPGCCDGSTGGRAPPAFRGDPQLLVGPMLKRRQIGEAAVLDVQGADDSAAALRLPLVLRRSRQAGINMEAHRLGIGAVLSVDLAPWPSPTGNSGLEVVDAVDGGDASKPDESLIVGVVPRQLIHGSAPDDDRFAAMAEHHDQAIDRDGTQGIADIDLTILDPISLDLSAWRRLNAPEGTQPRLGEMFADVLPNRLLAARVAVVLDEMGAQQFEVGRTVFGCLPDGILPPGRNDGGQAALLDEG